MFTAVLCVLLGTSPAAPPAPPVIVPPVVKLQGPEEVPEHALVRYVVSGVPDKAGLRWKISPSDKVDRATTTKDRCEFVAPPGLYTVELLVVTVDKDGAVQIDEFSQQVKIGKSVAPPPSVPPTVPGSRERAIAATGKLRIGNSGCTVTVIGPKREDGSYDILSAAHCVDRVGQKGVIYIKDATGKATIEYAVTVKALNKDADICWMRTDAIYAELVYTELATELPKKGDAVWHCGYGVSVPGNIETGTVTNPKWNDHMVGMTLFVSSGDSGSGIFDQNGRVVAVVYGTSWGSTIGGSCVEAAKLKPK